MRTKAREDRNVSHPAGLLTVDDITSSYCPLVATWTTSEKTKKQTTWSSFLSIQQFYTIVTTSLLLCVCVFVCISYRFLHHTVSHHTLGDSDLSRVPTTTTSDTRHLPYSDVSTCRCDGAFICALVASCWTMQLCAHTHIQSVITPHCKRNGKKTFEFRWTSRRS